MKKFMKFLRKKVTATPKSTLFYTGYNIGLHYGSTYDKTKYSVFCITKCFTLLLLAIAHYTLKMLWYRKNLDILTIVEHFHFIALYISMTVMCTILLSQSNKMKEFCLLLEKEFNNPKIILSPEQQEIKRKTNNRFYLIHTISSITFSLAAISTYVRRPFFDSKDKLTLPYEGWFPFEVDNLMKYITACIFQAIITINVVLGHYCAFITFVIQANHFCSQCEILNIYIEETFQYKSKIKLKNREQYIESRMRFAVKRHQLLIRCFNMLQELYNLFLLALSFTAGGIFCTAIYMITDPNSTIYLIIEVFFMMLPELIFIGLYCWFGQHIADQWSKIRDIIYNLNWFTESMNTRKTLLIIMIVCTKDKIIRGGGLQQYTLRGFSELLQTAFSSFNMLKAIR